MGALGGVPGAVLRKLPGGTAGRLLFVYSSRQGQSPGNPPGSPPGQFPQHCSRHSSRHNHFPQQSPEQSPQQFWGIGPRESLWLASRVSKFVALHVCLRLSAPKSRDSLRLRRRCLPPLIRSQKRTPKPKNRTNSTKEFSEQSKGTT